MWDLPRPGLEPVSPALAGGFLTTVPPGKSLKRFLMYLQSYTYNHQHNQITEHFITPKRNPIHTRRHSPFPLSTASENHESTFRFYGFSYSGHSRIIQYVAFCVWLLPFRIMFSRFIHLVARFIHSSLGLNNVPLYSCTAFCLSIHELMDIWIVSTF